MLGSNTQSFDNARQTIDPPNRFAQGTASSSRPAATMLRAIWNALRDGLGAHRHYEHLQSRGVSHDRALREALGIRTPASEIRAAAPQRCCPGADSPRTGEALCGRRVPARVHPPPRLAASAHVGNLAYLK
jgi:hypothetical protein